MGDISQPATLRTMLEHFPRLPCAGVPSPLERLTRLSDHLGGPVVWIKRDDLVGPGGGGNKGRALAYILAEAQQQKRKKIVTYGGLQSNHARMTAAACAKLGLEAHLFFFERRPRRLAGNLLLDALCQANMHFIPVGGGGNASLTLETTNRLVRLFAKFSVGRGAYFIPVGGHNVTGCLGYVEAALELARQVEQLQIPAEKTVVVTAAGTGGTLAGLLAGLKLLDSPIRVLGLDIGKLWKGFPASIARLANGASVRLGGRVEWRPEEIPLVEGVYAGPGYAKFTPAAKEAMQLMARQEGILLDPVYSGKAFAGLLDLLRRGKFGHQQHVIFLHTGGFPALWCFGDALL